MKTRWMLVAALAVVGCKKSEQKKAAVADAAPRAATPDAAPKAPAVPDAAADDSYKMPTGAVEIDDKALAKADGTALGTAVEARLVYAVGGDTGGPRKFDHRLVLTGGGKALFATVNYGYGEFEDGTSEGALIPADPMDPPGTFPTEDYAAPLPFKGPLLFLDSSQGGGMSVDLAIAQDGDALVVWGLVVDEGATPDDIVWTEDARIQLAPGAKVAAK